MHMLENFNFFCGKCFFISASSRRLFIHMQKCRCRREKKHRNQHTFPEILHFAFLSFLLFHFFPVAPPLLYFALFKVSAKIFPTISAVQRTSSISFRLYPISSSIYLDERF